MFYIFTFILSNHVIYLLFLADFPSEASSSHVSLLSGASLSDECVVTGCGNFAAPSRHGHCEDCYKRFYPEVIRHEAFAQRQMSEVFESNN